MPLHLSGLQFFQKELRRRSQEIAIDQPAPVLLVAAVDTDVRGRLVPRAAADPDLHRSAGRQGPPSGNVQPRYLAADGVMGAMSYLEENAHHDGLLDSDARRPIIRWR